MKLLVFGEILWDIIDHNYYLGGAAFNFAAHTVKCGGKAWMLSAVGKDDLGVKALEKAIELKVSVDFTPSLDQIPTSTVDVFLRDGQPDYTVHEGVAFDFISWPDLAEIQSAGCDVFYFGTLAQRSTVSRETLAALLEVVPFRYIFFDINLRKHFYSEPIVRYSLRHCNIFKINDSEAWIIGNVLYNEFRSLEHFAGRIATDYAIELIIITAAEKGCYIFHKKEFAHIPGVKVSVVDAVGAGDAFSAAFMSCYYRTQDAMKSAVIANEIGAFVAANRGAIPDYSERVLGMLRES